MCNDDEPIAVATEMNGNRDDAGSILDGDICAFALESGSDIGDEDNTDDNLCEDEVEISFICGNP